MPHNSNYGPGPPLLHRARFPSALSGPKVGNTLKHSVQSRFVARESMMAKVVKLSHTSSTCQFRRRGHLQCWARVGRRGRSLSSLTGTSVGTKFSFGGGQLPDKCPAITASRHQSGCLQRQHQHLAVLPGVSCTASRPQVLCFQYPTLRRLWADWDDIYVHVPGPVLPRYLPCRLDAGRSAGHQSESRILNFKVRACKYLAKRQWQDDVHEKPHRLLYTAAWRDLEINC